jgi:hypothetical protein
VAPTRNSYWSKSGTIYLHVSADSPTIDLERRQCHRGRSHCFVYADPCAFCVPLVCEKIVDSLQLWDAGRRTSRAGRLETTHILNRLMQLTIETGVMTAAVVLVDTGVIYGLPNSTMFLIL